MVGREGQLGSIVDPCLDDMLKTLTSPSRSRVGFCWHICTLQKPWREANLVRVMGANTDSATMFDVISVKINLHHGILVAVDRRTEVCGVVTLAQSAATKLS